MTIAAEKIKPSTVRFVLVRLTPARYVGPSLAAAGGGVYTMTFPYPMAALERNGAALTQVTTVTNNDEWSHVESTGLLTVKLASAPDVDTNVMCALYHLFYASGMDRTACQTPDDTTTQERNWQGFLVGSPETAESFTDTVGGIFSVSGSTVQIANTDQAFRAYLTDQDSFNRKEAAFWICLGSTASIHRAFIGRMGAVSLDSDTVTVTLEDAFINLTQPAYMGDTIDAAVFRDVATSFPNMYEKDHGKPVKFVFGRSKTKYVPGPYFQPDIFDRSSHAIDYQECEKAVCTNATASISGTTNRVWGIARTTAAGFKALNFGTITHARLSDDGLAFDHFTDYHGTVRLALVITTTGHNLEVGDSFSWTHASVNAGATQYAVVMELRSATDLLPNTIMCMVLSRSVAAAAVTVTTGTFNSNSAPAIAVYNPAITRGPYYLCYGLDFTTTVTTLASGNKYLSITFVNSFDSNATTNHDSFPYHPDIGSTGSASSFIDPARHIVAYRITQAAAGASHGAAMSALIDAAGMTVDAASVAAADVALVSECAFTIPYCDETEIGPYIKYCQDLLASTMGYVKFNADDTAVEYHLLAAPAAGETLGDGVLVQGDTSLDITYSDIVTEIQGENPHLVTPETIARTSPTESSAKARYLHGADNKIVLRHVLVDFGLRLPYILAVRSERRAVYKFRTSTELLDYALGDDATLSADVVIGGTTRAVKISSLGKGTEGVSAEATDLLGL